MTYTVVVDRRKPKLKVHADIRTAYFGVQGTQGPYFVIRATNHGPGRIHVEDTTMATRSWLLRWYKRQFNKDNTRAIFMNAAPESPDRTPKWLDVGESLTLFYPQITKIVMQEQYDGLYLSDSLGCKHWCQKDVFKKARESLAPPE